MAMRTTSSGMRTMLSPLSENITTMVKSSATSVIGLIFGMKRSWYHSLPFARTSTKRVTTPARNGMPR